MTMPNVGPRGLSEPVIAARLAMQTLGAKHALPEIERLCAEYPDDPDLRPLLALAALGMGDLERARREVKTLLADRPGAGAYGIAAHLAAFVNDPERDALLQRGQELDPDHFLVLRAAAECALMESDLPSARAVLTRSLELYPRDCETMRTLLMVYRHQNDVEAESMVLDHPPDWFAGTPHYHNCRLWRAMAYGDLAAAEEEGRSAVAASSGRDAQAWANLAVAQYRREKLDESEQSARHALDLNKRQASALNTLAIVAARRGDSSEAAAYARQAAEAIPALQGQRALYHGHEALQQKRTRAAIKAFMEAERSGPSYVARAARIGLVQSFLASGRFDTAAEKLEAAIDCDGLSDPLRCLRMQMLEMQGRHDEAEEDLHALTDGLRPFPAAIGLAMQMWKARGRDDRVAALAEYALQNLPGTGSDLAAMVIALDNAGFREESRRLFTAAEKRYPSDESLRLIAVGLAVREGREGHMRYELARLSPNARRRLLGPMAFLRPWFWRALVRGIFRMIRR